MQQPPLVSIIIPAHNAAPTIHAAIQSCIEQNYPNLECIVIDDGSTDATAAIITSVIDKHSSITLLQQNCQGPAAARNIGIKNAKGCYIQFLDADDVLLPGKIATHVHALLQDEKIDVVYGDYACVNPTDPNNQWQFSRVQFEKLPLDDFIQSWEHGFGIPLHCFLYKTSLFSQISSFDPTLENLEDWDLHIAFALTGVRYHYVPGVSVFYHFYEGSRTNQKKSMYRAKQQISRKYLLKKGIGWKNRLHFLKDYFRKPPVAGRVHSTASK